MALATREVSVSAVLRPGTAKAKVSQVSTFRAALSLGLRVYDCALDLSSSALCSPVGVFKSLFPAFCIRSQKGT